jgi:hypothetical protein
LFPRLAFEKPSFLWAAQYQTLSAESRLLRHPYAKTDTALFFSCILLYDFPDNRSDFSQTILCLTQSPALFFTFQLFL